MAYDPVKAHEYYLQFKKKGLKKGRKKGKKKATAKKGKQTNLVGLSNSGLNDAGKMQWAMTKEKLKNEMNVAMSKAKTQEEKDKIRSEYQNKALAELSRMKSDSATAKAKKEKAAKSSSKGSKSSSKGSSKSGSKSSSKESKKSSQVEMVEQIKDSIAQLQEKLLSLTPEQKEQIKETIQAQIDLIREKLKGKLTDINILSELR